MPDAPLTKLAGYCIVVGTWLVFSLIMYVFFCQERMKRALIENAYVALWKRVSDEITERFPRSDDPVHVCYEVGTGYPGQMGYYTEYDERQCVVIQRQELPENVSEPDVVSQTSKILLKELFTLAHEYGHFLVSSKRQNFQQTMNSYKVFQDWTAGNRKDCPYSDRIIVWKEEFAAWKEALNGCPEVPQQVRGRFLLQAFAMFSSYLSYIV